VAPSTHSERLPSEQRRGLHLALAGKGGSGKSVIAATLARLLARRGRPVLALDSDTLPGLSLSLGAAVPGEPPLLQAAEKDENSRWRLRKGIGPVRAVRRYATDAPDGVRLLQAGKSSGEGLVPVMGAVHAFHAVIHRLSDADAFREWDVVGDLPGGPRQPAFDWAPYADQLLLVVEPTWPSILTARRISRIAQARGPAPVVLVVNKVGDEDDAGRVTSALGIPALAVIPLDEHIREAERLGVALLDHRPDAPSIQAIEQLLADLVGDR
jgi:CO dehydrogenase maturation factor